MERAHEGAGRGEGREQGCGSQGAVPGPGGRGLGAVTCRPMKYGAPLGSNAGGRQGVRWATGAWVLDPEQLPWERGTPEDRAGPCLRREVCLLLHHGMDHPVRW